jgi:2-polyprenyl-3-methyl-5-hydroxy-6-metoxy-1,4-benzoquinol methylase
MSSKESKWDSHYSKAAATPQPCYVLKTHPELLPETGEALDLACGLGGNALWLAQHGLTTHAWDISAVALEKLAQVADTRGLVVNTRQRNVESSPPGKQSFDVLVVSHFLHRPVCKALVDALKPGGLLFYQTFLKDKPAGIGPSNPDYLLETGELPNLLNGLETLYYKEFSGADAENAGPIGTACFVGKKA